ncbi:MAG: thioredoxin family protein [Chlamydiales bacterium]|nr:thioredoxin family protein [Chlamydiales bacterium]
MKALTKFILGCSALFLCGGLENSSCGASALYAAEDKAHALQLPWQTDYTTALSQAESENKPLFVLFTGTDWCSWCVRLDKEVLLTPEFVEKVEQKFIFVKVDFPMKQALAPEVVKQNQELKDKFSIQGFPTIVLLTSKEQVIDKLGYSSGGGAKYAQKLLDSLNKNAKGK